MLRRCCCPAACDSDTIAPPHHPRRLPGEVDRCRRFSLFEIPFQHDQQSIESPKRIGFAELVSGRAMGGGIAQLADLIDVALHMRVEHLISPAMRPDCPKAACQPSRAHTTKELANHIFQHPPRRTRAMAGSGLAILRIWASDRLISSNSVAIRRAAPRHRPQRHLHHDLEKIATATRRTGRRFRMRFRCEHG